MGEVRAGGPGARKDRAPGCVRQAELAALNGALAGLVRRGALVAVRGPVGSGKSALLEAAARGWRAAGVQVVSGRFERPGKDAGPAAAFGFPAVVDALREHFEEIGEPRLAGPLAALSQACAGARDDTVAGLAPALGAVFDSIAVGRTVALVLDDADATPAPVLALTAARRPGCLVAVACQDRRTPASRQLEVAADLVIDLPDLSDDQIAGMLAHAGGAPPDSALLPALRAALGPLVGNPATLLATVEELRREGRLAVVCGHLCLTDPRASVALPEDHWLVTRVKALGAPAVALTTMAALSPLSISDLPMLADARRVELAEYGRITDRLVEGGVLTTDAGGGIHLRCAALGARLVADAGPVAVARLHRAFAAALFLRLGRGDQADRARLADHVTFAGRAIPLDERTATWLADVAAVASGDSDRAANWLRAALWHAGAGPQAGRIFTRLLRLLVQTGQYRRLAEVVDAASAADSSRTLFEGGYRADIAAAAMLAAAHLERPMPDTGRAPTGAGRAERAPADGQADCPAWAAAVGTANVPRWMLAERAGREAAADQPLLTAADVGMVMWALRTERSPLGSRGPRQRPAWGDRLLAAGSMGDLVTVFRLVLGRRYGRPVDGVLAAYQRMVRCYTGGEFAEVLSAAREIEVSAAPSSTAYQFGLLIAADTHALRGDLKHALACLAAVPDKPPYVALRAWVACGLAERMSEDPVAAVHDGWLAYARQRADGCRVGIEPLLARMAETAVSAGEPNRARAVLALVEALGHSEDRQITRETVLLVRATVRGNPTAAAAAVDLARRRGHRLALVHACLAIGRRSTDAAPWLREAYDVAKEWEAPYLRSRISALMRERGVSAPRAHAPRAVLSPVEAQIVELIRDGRTNRQIAMHLRISEKTVENSLTRLFAKTGLRSRVELAAATVGGDLLRATS